ncbi:MAG: NAD(P)H-dependent oxidoreductase [Desulfobacterales bacterium]
MSRLLYIQASPRGDRSYSLAAADAFIDAYKEKHPEDEVVTLNLFTMELPPFDGDVLNAKYAILNGLEHTEEERDAWQAIVSLIDEFKSADKYVFAIPMWNFHLPYRLKHYIDILTQPSYTFSFSPEEGYKGLVTGKPAWVAYARGGEYPLGSDGEALDFQTKYFEHILGFIGFTDIRTLVVEPTLAGGPDTAEDKRVAAKGMAREMALSF